MITSERVTVTDTPTALITADAKDATMGRSLMLRNKAGDGSSIDIGGAGVVWGQGFEVMDGEAVPIELDRGEILYAIAPTGLSLRVDVIRASVSGN